jgi:2-dehydro-3-deoxyphosphogluconate aldolase/(4S)-4-hydroxy-2-oxoglutarate aldolase
MAVTPRQASDGPTTPRERTVARLIELGAVAVLRLRDPAPADRVIDAICAGGVRAVEVTVTVPGAIELIERTARRLGDDVLLGVGSVLDAETARRAVDAGARYVVSPVFDAEVVASAHALGVPALPGAFSPSEILRAHRSGADIVKVFPAEVFGVSFIRGVLAPMPFLRLMPTGGVTPDNVGDWIRAGCVAVGVGSALLDPRLIAVGDYAGLTERARRMARGVADARAAGGAA